MKMKVLSCVFVVFLAFQINAQEVEWVTFEEAVVRAEKKPKKILIDIYTDWCGWCKKMDRDAYSNPTIAAYINENYYAVKFNAEQKESIEFAGHTFKFIAQGRRGVHELAAALTQNKLSYPTTVFMDEQFRIISPVPGYMDAKGMEPLLKFIGEDRFKDPSTSFAEYQKNHKSSL